MNFLGMGQLFTAGVPRTENTNMNKPLIASAIAAVLIIGCTTTRISESVIQKVESAAAAAASLGVAADLSVTPEHRETIESVKRDIEGMIASGSITSAQLASVISTKLPLDADTGQIVNGVLVFWGISEPFWVAPNMNEAVMAAARGFVRGIELGFASVPKPKASKPTNGKNPVQIQKKQRKNPDPEFGKNVKYL